MSVRLSFFALAAAAPAFAGVSYTFDTDAQGWGIVGGAVNFQWDGALGNGGPGSIRARDLVGGAFDTWFFAAPVVDLGDVSDLYGFDISYDIMSIVGVPGTNNDTAEIVLRGGGIDIGFSFGTPPTLGSWTSWSATVDATSGWRLMDSVSNSTLTATMASEAEIMAVLGDLQGLYIRGEYTNGEDQAALDNVSFVPSPGALSLMAIGGLIAGRRRRL